LKDPRHFANMARSIYQSGRGSGVEITKVEVRPMRSEGNLKAFCSVVFDDVFIVHSVKVIQGKESLFVAMPSREVKNGEFRDTAHPIDNSFRLRMEEIILSKYKEVVGENGEEASISPDIPTEDLTF